MKRLLLVFFSILFIHSYASEKYILTLPKSGTYLLKKIFNELMRTEIQVNHAHFVCGVSAMKKPYVVSMRDPRDFFISFKNFKTYIARESLRKGTDWPGMRPFNYVEYLSLPEDEKLLELLLYKNQAHGINKCDTILNMFQSVSQALQDPLALVIRFEDFIGENGGGNNELQKETVIEILEWLGISVSQFRVQYALSHCWGGSLTFHKGVIGQWREEFKLIHIEAFKNHWNQYLIDWGYETDWHWDANYLVES
jgi:hypothetical protein